MNFVDQFLWVIFPYIMLSLSILGHIYRYQTDPFGWSAQSSEILEKHQLRLASTFFHWGVIFALFGHLSGLLIPKAATAYVGITEELYHLGAVYAGGSAGLASLLGIGLLLYRRLGILRIRKTSSFTDILVVIFLLSIVLIGNILTIGYNVLASGYDYRATVSPWFRGLLTLTPDASLMVGVPFWFQLHVLLAFTIFGLWPFTRLVHIWSLPLSYIHRSYLVYRGRYRGRYGGRTPT